MIADHLTGIRKLETDLWKVADNLRANSNLASNEYFMPILGLIFLRHARTATTATTRLWRPSKLTRTRAECQTALSSRPISPVAVP